MAQLVDDQEIAKEQAEAARLLRQKTREYQAKGKRFEATGAGVMPAEEWERRKQVPADQVPKVQND